MPRSRYSYACRYSVDLYRDGPEPGTVHEAESTIVARESVVRTVNRTRKKGG